MHDGFRLTCRLAIAAVGAFCFGASVGAAEAPGLFGTSWLRFDMGVNAESSSARYSAVPAVADFDGDGDVDLFDFEAYLGCVAGPDAAGVPPGCRMFDFDGDEDVDFEDLGM